MGTRPGSQPPLKVDPELLRKYGAQLLAAADDLPDSPVPFTATGSDAISRAIAGKLPYIEGPIQDALPPLKDEASSTASKVIDAAGLYSNTDSQLAADYEKHQFESAGSPCGSGRCRGGVGASGSGTDGSSSMSQLGQLMSLPMQAMSAVAQVPQSVLPGVQEIGQMTGGTGSPGGAGQADDWRDDDEAKHDSQPGANARDSHAERASELTSSTAAAPQRSSPYHAIFDSATDL